MGRVHIHINNRTATLDRPYPYEDLIKRWSFSVPNLHHIYRYNPQYRRCKICHQFPGRNHSSDHKYIPTWDGKIKLLKNDRVPAGLFWATRKDLEKEGFKFAVDEIRVHTPNERSTRHWLTSEHEYKFQNDCVYETINEIKAGRGGLILNATGSGKTRIAAMLASRLDCSIIFVVDQLLLMHQAQKEISKHLGEEVGTVGESKINLKRVTVATIQTLHKHRKDHLFLRWYQSVEVFIIDEIHEALNRRNFDVIHIARPLSVIGLTATLGLSQKPTRLKAYSLCGPVLYEYPIQRGMQEGVLSKGVCISLQYRNHLDEIEQWTQAEAYNKRVVSNGERNTVISRLVRKAVDRGKYCIVVVDRVKHLEEVSDRLHGVKRRIVSGTYKGKGVEVSTRMKSKDKFEKGDIRCLIVNKVFKKGVDVKRVDLIINASAKPSVNDAIQVYGRGVRKHKDKYGLIAIDISDYDPENGSKNWLHRSAKKRARALKKIGITVVKIQWKDSASDILQKAEKLLKKEIKELKK